MAFLFEQTIDWTGLAAELRPRVRSDVFVEELGDEALVLDDMGESLVRLNATALAVWRLCDGTLNMEGIAASLVSEFQVSHDTALDDVEQLVAQFAESGLMEGEVSLSW